MWKLSALPVAASQVTYSMDVYTEEGCEGRVFSTQVGQMDYFPF